MSTGDNRRNKQLSERSVQGALILHILGHWVFFLLAMGIYLYFLEILSGDPANAWTNLQLRLGPTVIAVMVFTPIILGDLCKLSNRFAGPIVRLRRGMHDLAEGRTVSPIHFRDHDFWKDLAINFNRIAEREQASKNDHIDSDSDVKADAEADAVVEDAAC